MPGRACAVQDFCAEWAESWGRWNRYSLSIDIQGNSRYDGLRILKFNKLEEKVQIALETARCRQQKLAGLCLIEESA